MIESLNFDSEISNEDIAAYVKLIFDLNKKLFNPLSSVP